MLNIFLHYCGAHLICLITYKFCGWPERISTLDEKGGAFMKNKKKKKKAMQLCANKQFLGFIIVIIFQKDDFQGRLLFCLLFSCFLTWAFDVRSSNSPSVYFCAFSSQYYIPFGYLSSPWVGWPAPHQPCPWLATLVGSWLKSGRLVAIKHNLIN